jgi:hypothetical protein
VHPAAQWIRDELLRRALEEMAPEGKNRIAFTAGSNAAGKSTAIDFSGAREAAQAVFDSTFASVEHAQRLIHQALAVGKRITIHYVRRPLEEAFSGMLERSEREGRIVSIEQIINSDRGAAETLRSLWQEYRQDAKFQFRFFDNSGAPELSDIELASPRDYTEIRKALHERLEAEYRAGRIRADQYERIRGRGNPGEPRGGGPGSAGGAGGSPQTGPGESNPEGSRQESDSGLNPPDWRRQLPEEPLTAPTTHTAGGPTSPPTDVSPSVEGRPASRAGSAEQRMIGK